MLLPFYIYKAVSVVMSNLGADIRNIPTKHFDDDPLDKLDFCVFFTDNRIYALC